MKRAIQVVVMMMAASMVSGCASLRAGQEMKRLQAQVGLIDERVTQLERAGGTWQASGIAPEPVIESSSTADAGATTGGASSKDVAVSSKPSTREIQQALKNAGFYQAAIDGKMGPLTRDAVKEFQRVHGLTDDGVVGKKTWAKLSAYTDLSSSTGELNAAEILK